MHDSGAYDGKILCVPVADPRQRSIKSIRQIAPTQLEDVAEFFRTYKSLEGRVVVIDGWRDSEAVEPLLNSCITAANASLSFKNILAPCANIQSLSINTPPNFRQNDTFLARYTFEETNRNSLCQL